MDVKPKSEVEEIPIHKSESSEDFMTCFKCNGSKLNKTGKRSCSRCGGEGILRGEFFIGLNKLIKDEMKLYC